MFFLEIIYTNIKKTGLKRSLGMGKKVMIFLVLAAMLLGTVAMSAGAAGSQPYQVGYAKVDINPYWHAWMEWSRNENNSAIPDAGTYPYQDFYEPYDLLPLPMAGYGGNESRLSRPKLMEIARSTRSMAPRSRCPIRSFSRRLSNVRICSRRMMESLARP